MKRFQFLSAVFGTTLVAAPLQLASPAQHYSIKLFNESGDTLAQFTGTDEITASYTASNPENIECLAFYKFRSPVHLDKDATLGLTFDLFT